MMWQALELNEIMFELTGRMLESRGLLARGGVYEVLEMS
jgi:hypothetical protein